MYYVVRHSTDAYIILKSPDEGQVYRFMAKWYPEDVTVDIVFESEDNRSALSFLHRARLGADRGRQYTSVTRQVDPFVLAAPNKELAIPF